jgi:hypothetical protein
VLPYSVLERKLVVVTWFRAGNSECDVRSKTVTETAHSCDLRSSSCVIRTVKSRKLRTAGHIVHIGIKQIRTEFY